MAVNVPGIIAVVVFYIIILVVGIIVSRKTVKNKSSETVLIADRTFGLFVSIFTLTAGAFYAPKIRREGYITMFDPFQLKYGKKVGAILFIPQLCGDIFWCAAVLAALGATISITLDLNATLSILVSAAVAITYTFLGGLYAVAYTDIMQLIFMAIGLVVVFPFCLVNPAVDLSRISYTYLGEIPAKTIASYIDVWCVCLFGGIPWQTFFQRILACRTTRIAWISTMTAGSFSLLFMIPVVLIGFSGSAADWNATAYDGPVPIPDEMRSFILPLALQYLTPVPVSIVGIGAISAAVMSTCDSTIFSSSSIICKNIYHDIIRPEASERERMWVLRITIVIVGSMSALLAIFSSTIYGLYVLAGDLSYVALFPQLTLVLWMPQSNAYGSVAGFFVSMTLRLLSGEPYLWLQAVIKFPYYDEETQTQLFPHRTFAMLLGTLSMVVVSMATNAMFLKGLVPRKYDVLQCSRQRSFKKRCNTKKINEGEGNRQLVELNDVNARLTL